jgi:hypothetical protein
MTMRTLSLITNEHTANTILESWFVQNAILPEMPFGLEMEATRLSGGVVVYLEVGRPKADLIASLTARGNRVVLFHMGDEIGANYDRDCYLACDLILRNYHHAAIFDDAQVAARTLWVPNGFKSGVGPRQPSTLRRATQRRFLSCFLGWLDNAQAAGDERSLFRDMARRHPTDILLRPSNGFGGGFRTGLYATTMEYAVFCPCPAGNSPETIRLYDALELGCIPVSLRHPFLTAPTALADPPFPILDSWEAFPTFLAQMRGRMTQTPQAIDDLQTTCIAWWTALKRSLAARVADRLLALQRG